MIKQYKRRRHHLQVVGRVCYQCVGILDSLRLIKYHTPPMDLEERPTTLLLSLCPLCITPPCCELKDSKESQSIVEGAGFADALDVPRFAAASTINA